MFESSFFRPHQPASYFLELVTHNLLVMLGMLVVRGMLKTMLEMLTG